MIRLNMIAKDKELYVIEDACQAHGATYNGKKVGSFGSMSAFSFYPSKNLGCAGDGGAITTDDGDFYKKILSLRDHGQSEKSVHSLVGYNSRLDEIQACILDIKLKRLDRWNDNRRKVSWIYDRIFKGVFIGTTITPLEIRVGCVPIFHLYVVKTTKRDAVIEKLKQADIQFGIHYPTPIHLQPAYKYLGYKEGDFPMAEQFCKEIISLPMYPEMSLSEVDLIGKIVLYG